MYARPSGSYRSADLLCQIQYKDAIFPAKGRWDGCETILPLWWEFLCQYDIFIDFAPILIKYGIFSVWSFINKL